MSHILSEMLLTKQVVAVLEAPHFHLQIGCPSFSPELDLWHASLLGKTGVIMGVTFGAFSAEREKSGDWVSFVHFTSCSSFY